jgi:hypothetical protein
LTLLHLGEDINYLIMSSFYLLPSVGVSLSDIKKRTSLEKILNPIIFLPRELSSPCLGFI